MSGYGSRYWVHKTSLRQRPKFPKFRGDRSVDAVVIGGGLTGCAAAHVLAAAGHDVVLLEADRLAGGSTAAGLGVVLPEPDATFRDVEAAAGRRVARAAWKEARRASREFATALRKLPVKRDVSSSSLLINARTSDAAIELRREQAARKVVGLDAAWSPARSTASELGTDTSGALRLPDALLIDPVKATLAMARAADADGAHIFERSRVRRTKFTRQEATVVTESGVIRTGLVFVATGAPGSLFSQLKRHVRQHDGYVVVTEPLTGPMRREAGRRSAVVTETGSDRRWLRWLSQDRAMFGGALGRPASARQRDKTVIQRTGQLMYEFSLRYPVISGLPATHAWDVPVTSTQDGLPWIGQHRNYPFHFFALAFGWHGDGLAWLAARAALRSLRGETRREDDTFGFARHL